MPYRIFLLILAFLILTSCNQPTKKVPTEIVGVWQIKDISSQSTNKSLTKDSIPSLFIFTPTEKIRRYDSFVVNSGTYEIKDSFLTAYPIIARVPEFMGGKLVCEFKVEGDTLQLKLVDEYSFDGMQAPWVASGNGLILTLVCADRTPS
jgi:hypothetical protein